MSKVEDKGRQNSKYDKFDKLDTATLEAILRADFGAPEAEQLAAEEVLYIASLVAERWKFSRPDIDKAQEEFYQYYYPLDRPIYDFGDEEDDSQNKIQTETTQYKNDKKVLPFYKKAWRKFASVAAVLVLFMFVGTVTAYALGYNPFPVRPVWDEEHFWFEKDVPTFEMLQAVSKYENIDNLIPQWLPNGYKFEKIETSENDSRISLTSSYYKETENNTEVISISCLYLNDYKNTLYEKDAYDVITYPVHNTDYYIMTDKEYLTVAWNSGNTEYYITGEISVDDAKKMIDSIYDD